MFLKLHFLFVLNETFLTHYQPAIILNVHLSLIYIAEIHRKYEENHDKFCSFVFVLFFHLEIIRIAIEGKHLRHFERI